MQFNKQENITKSTYNKDTLAELYPFIIVSYM